MAILFTCIAISLFLSVAIIRGMTRHYRKARASSNWPTVPGTLLHAEVLQRRDSDEPAYEHFKLDLRYAYEFHGERYESTQFQFYQPDWSRPRMYWSDLEVALRANPELTVYANPDDPTEAVLFPGANTMRPGILAALGVLAVVAPIVGIIAIYWLWQLFHE